MYLKKHFMMVPYFWSFYVHFPCGLFLPAAVKHCGINFCWVAATHTCILYSHSQNILYFLNMYYVICEGVMQRLLVMAGAKVAVVVVSVIPWPFYDKYNNIFCGFINILVKFLSYHTIK